jgi:tetratricopeptide (TPR) repeat protein
LKSSKSQIGSPGPRRGLVAVLLILVIVGLGVGAFTVFRPAGLVRRIAAVSPGGAPPESIEGLRAAIGAYEAKVEEAVGAAAQAGIYWKILAVRYMDRKMYGEALDALKSAVDYFPEDATLHYLTGISAAVMAKSSLDFAAAGSNRDRERLYALAESAHKRALSIEPNYARPLYALGVLLVFELDRPVEAIPYLEKYLSLQAKDADAMFVLARAYYVTGKKEAAVELYDRIISTTKDEKKRTEAAANKKTVLDEDYAAR